MRPLSLAPAVLLVLAAVAAPLPAAAQTDGPESLPRWTLAACLDSAVAHSPSLAAARHRRAAARAQAAASRADRLPRLGLDGSASYVSETTELTLPLGPGGTPQTLELGTNQSYDLALGVQTPLFAGGALREREAALRAQAAALGSDLAADSLVQLHGVREAFYQALAAEATASAAEQAVQRVRRHLDDIREGRDAGTVGREAELAARARLRETEQRLASSRAAARAARLELGRLVGHPGREVGPRGGLERSLAPDTALRPIPAERPDLQALEARISGGEHSVRAARGALWPTVQLSAAYHYGKPGVDQIADEWMGYATAGVRFSWTLYDWGARGQRTEEARTRVRALEANRRGLEEAWTSRFEQADARRAAARDAAELAGHRVQLERERVELVRQRHREGMASEAERLDAEDDLTAAELEAVRARAQLRLAEVDLLFILGR